MMMKSMMIDESSTNDNSNESQRVSLITKLSERYAAYQHIAKSIFGKKVVMPITDLQELVSIRRENPSFYQRDTDATGGKTGALAEIRWPEGVSNLLEAMKRISTAEKAIYAYRLLSANPNLKIPKTFLTDKMGGGYGSYRIMTKTFDQIIDQSIMEEDLLTIEDVKQLVVEQSAVVNFVLQKENWQNKQSDNDHS
jgi:hypothetical protein